MKNIRLNYLFAAFGIVLLSIFLAWMTKDEKRDNAMYVIRSGNDKTYYANTFRMFGRGIAFDDVHGKKIILTGDIDIEYLKNSN